MNIKQIYADNKVHLQQTSYTCGPSSLLNALRLRGDDSWDEPRLARLCRAREEVGTDNDDLVRAARKVGLAVIEAKADATIAEVEAHLDRGHLVIVNYRHAFNGAGHFGLVVDHDRQAFYLADSSLGLVRLKKVDLKSNWQSRDGSVRHWLLALK